MPIRINNRVYIKQLGFNPDKSQRKSTFYFDLTESISVKHSWNEISKTATVKLPRRMQVLFYDQDPKTAKDQHATNALVTAPNMSGKLDGAVVPTELNTVTSEQLSEYVVRYMQMQLSAGDTFDGFNRIATDNENHPLIQRGDCIRIDAGYEATDERTGGPLDWTGNIFFGYVTGILIGDSEIVITCEDYAYVLRQTRLPAAYFHVVGNPTSSKGAKGKYNIGKTTDKKNMDEATVREMISILSDNGITTKTLSKTTIPLALFDVFYPYQDWIINYGGGKFNPGIDVADNPKFWMGDWTIENTASLYDVIEKLSTAYGVHPYFPDLVSEPYFGINSVPDKYISSDNSSQPYQDDWTNLVNNKLNLGTLVYNPKIRIANLFKFGFQTNIISSSLEYRRKDDIIAGAYVKGWTKTLCDEKGEAVDNESPDKVTIKKVTPGGLTFKAYRTQIKHAAITVGDLGGIMYTFMYSNQMGTKPAMGEDGKVGVVPDAQTYADMVRFGEDQLNKYHYTGYKGCFTTLGFPFVRVGDLVEISDELFPERKGVYAVKGVNYTSSPEAGSRQEITVDYFVCSDSESADGKEKLRRFQDPDWFEQEEARLKSNRT